MVESAFSKLIEIAGRELRPLAFAIFAGSLVALVFGLFGSTFPFEQTTIALVGFLSFVYWSYSPIALALEEKAKKRITKHEEQAMRVRVLALSAEAQSVLYLWLTTNTVSFFCYPNGAVVRELDNAGFIWPSMHQSGDGGFRPYQLTQWYYQFAIDHRTWLLAHLRKNSVNAKSAGLVTFAEERI